MLTVGSLFAGIGGLEYGLEQTGGFRTIWQVENDPFAVAVLEKHWPDVQRFGDIRELDPESLGRVDLVCGGFPCQPVSTAGKRRGRKDDRWLWPHFVRVLRHLRPRFVLVENVPGILAANDGAAFAEVLGDLAALGYDVEWATVPAAAVGAPHLRYRVFVVAYAYGDGFMRGARESDSIGGGGGEAGTRGHGEPGPLADTPSDRARGSPGQAGRVDGSDAGRDGAGLVAHASGNGAGTGEQRQGGLELARAVQSGQGVADAEAERCASGRAGEADEAGAAEPQRRRDPMADSYAVRLGDGGASGVQVGPSASGSEALREVGAGSQSLDVADADGERRLGGSGQAGPQGWATRTTAGWAHPCGPGLEVGRVFGRGAREQLAAVARGCVGPGGAWPWEPERGLDRIVDGVPGGVDGRGVEAAEEEGGQEAWERGVPRVAMRQKNRQQRIKALGNAVVPQVAFFIGLRILEAAKEAQGE